MLSGAAVECRIYAEDPDNNFFPSPGKIVRLRTPSGPGVRDDTGVYEGWTVPIDYDPHDFKTGRLGANSRRSYCPHAAALREYQIEGIKSNIAFFREILRHPDFMTGDFDTGFIDGWLKGRSSRAGMPETNQHLAAIAAAFFHSQRLPAPVQGTQVPESLWKVDGRRRGLRNE